MRYTINGGVFVRLPGKWGTGREAAGLGTAGLGPRRGRPRGQGRGLRGLPSRDLWGGLH